jgi:hypothetical protein
MKMKPVAILSPMCLCLFAGTARADLEPFSFGASETLQHQSNLNHTDDGQVAPVSDWISTTEFSAALDQALGRDKLVAAAAVDFNRYKRTHGLDATGYKASAEFDWNTVGDLSGAIGADSQRRQYVYGETADPTPGTPAVVINTRNLQTDNHAFARIALGGESRWTIFGGLDANQRNYSNETFDANEERQWSTNAGTNYSTSPDLSFGLTGSYVRGEYPHGLASGGASDFNSRSISATTKWQASGNSAVDASVGFTSQDNDALTSDQHFINGSFNWTWTPPSHFTVIFGLKRSSNADTGTTGATTGIVNANNLNGTSINNVAHLDVMYDLTAKIKLEATADYTQRSYSDLKLLDSTDVSGKTRTSRFYLTAHYQPTRTVDLSCGGGREIRRIDSSLADITPAYTDTYYQCVAAIRFD